MPASGDYLVAQAGEPIVVCTPRCGQGSFLRLHSKLVRAELLLQMGFYHRNEVYQAYVDVPLSRFADEDPQTPESLRLVLTAELCTSLAEADMAKPNGCRLAALLELAFAAALDERCSHSQSHVP